ncbi:MAG: hypothetical protein QOG96_2162, partial [Pseudonocardiales bacterium]|nr:hypothetical protein [Pseudonocardiales bacterium]
TSRLNTARNTRAEEQGGAGGGPHIVGSAAGTGTGAGAETGAER